MAGNYPVPPNNLGNQSQPGMPPYAPPSMPPQELMSGEADDQCGGGTYEIEFNLE